MVQREKIINIMITTVENYGAKTTCGMNVNDSRFGNRNVNSGDPCWSSVPCSPSCDRQNDNDDDDDDDADDDDDDDDVDDGGVDTLCCF